MLFGKFKTINIHCSSRNIQIGLYIWFGLTNWHYYLQTWVWDWVGPSSMGVAPCWAWVGRGGAKVGGVVCHITGIEQSIPLQPGSQTHVLMLEHFWNGRFIERLFHYCMLKCSSTPLPLHSSIWPPWVAMFWGQRVKDLMSEISLQVWFIQILLSPHITPSLTVPILRTAALWPRPTVKILHSMCLFSW